MYGYCFYRIGQTVSGFSMGHRKMYWINHLIINKKKVYRLMKQARLLLKKKGSGQAARCVVEVRKMSDEGPDEAFTGPPMRFDIKMYWVAGLGWVPCLSVIDIFTRQLKAYLLQGSIRQDDVKALWQDLLARIPTYQHSRIRVRFDNGSQFAVKPGWRSSGAVFFCGPTDLPGVLPCSHARRRWVY